MSAHYADIAFTDHVAAVQERYGSQQFYARRRRHGSDPDQLTPDVRAFLTARDSFYLATVHHSAEELPPTRRRLIR